MKEECKHCNGTGFIKKATRVDLYCTCEVCQGHRKVDWIDNICVKKHMKHLNSTSFTKACRKSIEVLINLLSEYSTALGYHLKIEMVPYERNERGVEIFDVESGGFV